MSNIRIDNPQRLLALAEQMNGFQNAFEKFIENMRNAVKTTMEQLTRLKIIMQEKIDAVEREISSLYNERSNYSYPEDKESIWQIDSEIKSLKSQKTEYIEHKKQIDTAYKNIDYQYKRNGVKDREEKLLQYIQKYPKGIGALFSMEAIMNQYLQFSSDIVKTAITGNEYGKFISNEDCIQSSNFRLYEEEIDEKNSDFINRISYGRLKSYEPLTDQILSNAELEAQKKKAKYLEFEIGDKDIELCQNAGYRVFEETINGLVLYNPNKSFGQTFNDVFLSNSKLIAKKDLHNEIDLTGGFLKGGAFFKSSQKYELDN